VIRTEKAVILAPGESGPEERMSFDEDYVPSPCVRVCALDDRREICVGCLRTVAEIKAWRGMTAEGKRALLEELERRRASLPGAHPLGVTQRA